MTSSGMGGTKASSNVKFDDKLYQYVLSMGTSSSPGLKRILELTEKHPRARMMGAPDEARLFQVLARTMGAKRVLEIGVFTGYTTLAFAEALPADGQVVGLDIEEEYVAIGRPVWAEAGVAHKIDIRIAPALDSLNAMVASGEPLFDMAFVDADKKNYPAYVALLLKLVRPNGLILVDNVVWHGAVIDDAANDEDTVAIRRVNEMLRDEPRLDIVMLAIADGVTIARVK